MEAAGASSVAVPEASWAATGQRAVGTKSPRLLQPALPNACNPLQFSVAFPLLPINCNAQFYDRVGCAGGRRFTKRDKTGLGDDSSSSRGQGNIFSLTSSMGCTTPAHSASPSFLWSTSSVPAAPCGFMKFQ